MTGDPIPPFARALLTDQGLSPEDVPLAIDPRDEMLEFLAGNYEGDRDRGLFTYFRSGLSIADALTQILAWRFGGGSGDLAHVERLMDFASGYGRITRFLLRSVPKERLWVSDVYAEAVRFQEERFGVHGLVSTIRPEDFACAERFDAITVTSLFTHLPEERFAGWLRRLLGLLRPGGVLLFSVHGEMLLDPAVTMPEAGIVFQELSESRSLETCDYGSTWVTERFVRSAVARAAEAPVSLWRAPRGLCNFQDLYVAIREEGVDFSSLALQMEPLLLIETCELERPGLLTLSGWTVALSGEAREVQASVDGRVVAAAPVQGMRSDVAAVFGDGRLARSGWSLAVPLPPGVSRNALILIVRVVDARGVGHPLWASTVETARLHVARQDLTVADRRLGEMKARLAAAEGRAAAEIEALRTRIAHMEASRFWKLRNAWFRLKGLFSG